MKIQIDEIDSDNYRRHRDTTDFQASMMAVGQVEPITVVAKPDGRYDLVSGEGRLVAARALGWTEIEANVREAGDADVLLLSVAANVRHAVNPLDLAAALKHLLDGGMGPGRVADAAGLSLDDLRLHLKLLDAADDVKAAIRDGRLAMTAFRFLCNQDVEAQAETVKAARARKSDGRITIDSVRTAKKKVDCSRYVERGIDDPRTAVQKVNDALRLLRGVADAAPYEAATRAAIDFGMGEIKEEVDKWLSRS